MAGIKITDLPPVVTPALTDVFPIDQGAVTYKESVSDVLSLFQANGQALTRTNDTNVTMILGGSPNTALLNATSMTLGWTGQLSVPRGGTGNSTFTAYSVICAGTTATGAFQNVSGVGTANQVLTSNGAGALPTWQAGGTVSPLTTKGDLYTFTTVNARLPVGTINGQILQVNSGSATGLAWSTATYPATANNVARILRSDGTNWVQTTATFADSYGASEFLYSNGANNVAGLATANNGLPVTGNTGIPSILAGPGTTGNFLQSNAAAAPSWSTATFPSVGGAAGNILISNGTNYIASTSLWPNTVGTAGKILRSDGTVNAYTTSTYPDTNAVSTLLYASSANVMAALATANSSILVTNSGGVPSWSTTLPAFTTSSITFSPTTGGIVGTTTNDNVAAGKVGEFVSSVIASASAVSLADATATNVTSISLTAGDWDVWGNTTINCPTNDGVTMYGWVSSTSATLPDISLVSGSVKAAQTTVAVSVPQLRFSLSGTTTIYLSAYATTAAGTRNACGGIYARRVR